MALTHWVCFLFLERTANVLASNLGMLFRRLLHLGSIPVCWKLANVTQIPKCLSSSSVVNFRPISIASVLSKVFECWVSVSLGRFVECRCVLPTTGFR